MSPVKPTLDQLTAKYIELRDRKADIKKKAEEEQAKVTALMEKIEDSMKETLHKQGVKSAKTDHGTVYIGHRESAGVADWNALLDYIRTTERWDLLERRVAKGAVKDIMEEDRNGNYLNPPPPGVDFKRFETINVRRS